jgi:DNA-binding NarL/FixJ family response regulator
LAQAAAPRVLVATPVRLYREGIVRFLDAAVEVVVVGSTTGPAETLAHALELTPDVVLLDMALADSRDTVRALRRTMPRIAVVALALAESEEDVLGCAEVGISAYVPNDSSLEELVVTVRRAARGEAVCPPRIVAGLFRRVAVLSAPDRPARDERAPLTTRERQVLRLVDAGLSNKQIGRELHIELATVKNHVHSILHKLGATSRGEAAARVRVPSVS